MRSNFCNHISCFDAFVYFTMNEQVPSWSCPICSKSLRFEDMTVDGYFAEILKECPSSVEEVIVEPDGTWRTSDGKYGTSKLKPTSQAGTSADNAASPVSADAGGKERAEELTLDSDDEAPLAKRARHDYDRHTPLSVGSTPAAVTSAVAPARRVEVIDLTLSDSDDEGATAPRTQVPPATARPTISIPLADRKQAPQRPPPPPQSHSTSHADRSPSVPRPGDGRGHPIDTVFFANGTSPPRNGSSHVSSASRTDRSPGFSTNAERSSTNTPFAAESHAGQVQGESSWAAKSQEKTGSHRRPMDQPYGGDGPFSLCKSASHAVLKETSFVNVHNAQRSSLIISRCIREISV
jgi:hypothetical protein